MSDFSQSAKGYESILAQFVAKLEELGTIVISEFAREYPALAEEFRSLAAMGKAVDRSRPELEELVPEKLGEFRIVRRLARGGMGDIYEAYDERLQRRVAIKTIRHGRISNDARDRFLREQTVLARLHQSHIVPIYAAGEQEDLQYFAMPYIEGAALHDVIAAARSLESTESGSKTLSLAKLAAIVTADTNPKRERGKPFIPDDAKRQAEVRTTSFGGEVSPFADSPLIPASPCPRVSPSPRVRVSLSPAYFRSVAEVLADAADAVHHAHGVHILHRDVKPSNIMVDTAGQCWIIDFGLAALVQSSDGVDPKLRIEDPSRTDQASILDPRSSKADPPDLLVRSLTQAGQIQGTPQYMAPEQYRGQADARSDVWGLGVTLYELLTLRRAFDESSYPEVAKKVLSEELTPPGEGGSNLPRDLSAICCKAMQKEPSRRYPSALEFADDLRRWLRMEPTRARPAWPLRRTAMWARRNKGWAAAIAIACSTILVAIGYGFHAQQQQLATKQRELDLMELQRLRLTKRIDGWSKDAWEKARKLAAIGRDAAVRDQATDTLAGLDAERIFEQRFLGASSVAIDATGKRLLTGGWTPTDRKWPAQPARLWNDLFHEPLLSKQVGTGPVIFDPNGRPLQLVPPDQERHSILLWDVDKQLSVAEFPLTAQEAEQVQDLIRVTNGANLSLSADGAYVAARIGPARGSGILRIWDAKTQKPLPDVKDAGQTIALSSDGKLLATGDENGTIVIRSLPKLERLAQLQDSNTHVLALTFGRHVRRTRRANAPDSMAGRLLAVAGKGSALSVWDLETGGIVSKYQRSTWDAFAVTLSPDGTLLATAGRSSIEVFDVASGLHLLSCGDTFDWSLGITFTSDGRKIATSSGRSFHVDGGVQVSELKNGRGIKTLRGLDSSVEKVIVSPDGKRVAGLSRTWQVAIWDADSGQLLHLLDVPKGVYADNAGLAFNSDGTRFAFSTSRSAVLWDLTNGKLLDKWDLPTALGDQIGFHPTGKLLLFRVESQDQTRPQRREPPYAGRIRHLLPGKSEVIATIAGFEEDFYYSAGTQDARWFSAWGLDRHSRDGLRRLSVFEGNSGKEIFSDMARTDRGGVSFFDPSGTLLGFHHGDTGATTNVIELPSGKLVFTYQRDQDLIYALAPRATHFLVAEAQANGVPVYRRGGEIPLVKLKLDFPEGPPCFSPDGRRLALGNLDGTVFLCDLEEVRRRLTTIGLGW
jgi:serine/threonine protein kinase/WD40 repeat protein